MISSTKKLINGLFILRLGDYNMQKDNVELKVSYQGKLEEVSAGLESAVSRELRSKTGLMGDVSLTNLRYAVILQPANDSRASVGYSGTSTSSLDDAVVNATKSSFNTENVTAQLEVVAEVPYFTVPVVVRSLSKEKLEQYSTQAVRELQNTYGNRVNANPTSIDYKVLHSKTGYVNDTNLPKDEMSWIQRKFSIVSEAVSKQSLEDAETRAATKSKKVKSTVYEQRSQVMIYGQPEGSIAVNEEGMAVPMIITSSKTLPRAAQPAAKDPVSLSSPYALM